MHFKQPMNYQPWALQVVSNLVRVRSLVARHIARQDEARTNEFLYAAARATRTASCRLACCTLLPPVRWHSQCSLGKPIM